jgi:hypothetical protein
MVIGVTPPGVLLLLLLILQVRISVLTGALGILNEQLTS